MLPPTSDLRAALGILEAQMAPATRKHVAWCISKLAMAFEPSTKLSEEDTRFRASIWLEACGDLGDDLWSKATLAAIQTSKWMPKPAEFRKLVEREFDERAKRLKRCREMLAGTRVDPAKPDEFIREPEDVRLRTLRDSLRRVGQVSRAAVYERQIAEKEGREPEAWATAVYMAPAEVAKASDVADVKPSAVAQARMLRSVAHYHREKGRIEYADKIDSQADELAPRPASNEIAKSYNSDPHTSEPPPRDAGDVPEAAHGGAR